MYVYIPRSSDPSRPLDSRNQIESVPGLNNLILPLITIRILGLDLTLSCVVAVLDRFVGEFVA